VRGLTSRTNRRNALLRAIACAGALISSAVTTHTIANVRHLRTIEPSAVSVAERVSVLLPLRNEAGRVTPTLQALLAQEGIDDLEILVLDDGSTDDTGTVVESVVGDDSRVRLIDGGSAPLPDGWLGKPWACHRLSEHATGSVLVFIDADVVAHPLALASTIHHMRTADLDLISPYPRQIAITWAERIIQPLLVWSWMATLPLRLTETTHYPSLAAANGQFLCVDARAYRISGGHTAVAGQVVEDVEVLRALKRHGFTGAPANGAAIADCRMYDGTEEIIEGYTKSLWSFFGSATGAAAVVGVMVVGYVAPPVFAAIGSDRTQRLWGAIGYVAGITGRFAVATRTAERRWPDVALQPLSVAAFAALTIESFRRRRTGALRWRGRTIS